MGTAASHQPMGPHAHTTILSHTLARTQSRRGKLVLHRIQTVQAMPARADPRAREQNPRCAPMHGAHEHPAHEQDTLRASFGVRLLAPFSRPLSRLSSDRTFRGQSLAENAQSDAVQLTRLPGFGSKKVFRRGTFVSVLRLKCIDFRFKSFN